MIADERQAGDILSPAIICDRLRAYGNQCFAIVRSKVIVMFHIWPVSLSIKYAGSLDHFHWRSLALLFYHTETQFSRSFANFCDSANICDHMETRL